MNGARRFPDIRNADFRQRKQERPVSFDCLNKNAGMNLGENRSLEHWFSLISTDQYGKI